jgi:histidine ammonia-lyase
MGMTAALKLRQILENRERIAAIELMCAAEGIECRSSPKPGREVGQACGAVRGLVPRLAADRPLGQEIDTLARAIRNRLINPGTDL